MIAEAETAEAIVAGRGQLRCNGVAYQWGAATDEVLHGVSFAVRPGEIVGVLGPSGCGKTTLLKVLCGLLAPTEGTITLGDELVTAPDRRVGIVFQNAPLYPWLSVRSNVEFGLKLAGVSPPQRRARSEEVLQRVGLWPFRSFYPHELSGGMRQRVAVAQAVSNESQFLLLDEPFGALDYQTRLLMQHFALDIRRDFGTGIVLVTHQVDEALLLCERVVLMAARPGRIEEVIEVDLPYPRDVTGDQFNRYRARITSHLEREVMLAFGSQ